MSRETTVQVRLHFEEKERIQARAIAAGCESVSEYLRQLGLGSKVGPSAKALTIRKRKGQARASDSSATIEEAKQEPALPKVVGAIPVEAGTTPGSLGSVPAEIEEAKLTDDPARKAFVERRATQLHAQGKTSRLAKQLAEAEWRNR